MTLKMVVQLVCILGAVFSDAFNAIFLLDNIASTFRLSNSVLQDKDTFKCSKNDECKFIIKDKGRKNQISSRWYKFNMALGAEDCSTLKFRGVTKSSIYPMLVNGKLEQIPCDMTTDGGGWTVFQRRVDGAVNFNRNLRSYKLGFGDRSGSFWLGLDLMHFMVSQWNSELRADFTDYKAGKRYAKYGYVYITDESKAYNWTVSKYSGTVGDAFRHHNNMKFGTYDRDNDKHDFHCADVFKGGFWFSGCFRSNPNGLFERKGKRNIGYMHWNDYHDLKFFEMKLRRKLRQI